MKKMLLLVVALVLVAGIASAGIVNTAHDMRTHITNESTQQVCVFCHTPHQPNGRTTDPLWNHSMSTNATYGVYSSPTMNVVPTELGVGTTTSHLCLSCHDGTVAVNSLWKQPLDGTAGSTYTAVLTAGGMIAPASSGYIGIDLQNDHPVNFTYATSWNNEGGASGTGLYQNPSGSTPLIAGMVQCASCHQVHDNQYPPFLRMSNSGSGLCLNCHIK